MSKGNVLVVDDSLESLRLLRTVLVEAGYDVRPTPSGAMALRAARALPPDLVLLDVNMPEMSGFEVCRTLKGSPETADVPVIFLTGLADAQEVLTAFEMGAADYVTKPFEKRILLARVQAHIQLRQKTQQLQLLAETDPLSALANRRRFDAFLAAELRRARRDAKPVSLLIADVDHFKRYNDHYGHVQGDDVIRKVAQVFADSGRRTSDLPARYGGEEFALVLGGTDGEAAHRVAVDLCQSVAALGIPHEGSPVGPVVTISVGCLTVVPDEATTPVAVVARADELLYEAKRQGRNRVVCTAP